MFMISSGEVDGVELVILACLLPLRLLFAAGFLLAISRPAAYMVPASWSYSTDHSPHLSLMLFFELHLLTVEQSYLLRRANVEEPTGAYWKITEHENARPHIRD